MIAFDFGKPSFAEIADLKAGDWVFFDFPESPATVSVLVPDVNDGVALLLLSGPSAFNVYPVDKRYGPTLGFRSMSQQRLSGCGSMLQAQFTSITKRRTPLVMSSRLATGRQDWL